MQFSHFFPIALLLISSFIIPDTAQAKQDGDRYQQDHQLKASGPRSSPFTPPSKDVFVTDSGPSLDTGCVFNTSSEHPLRIDIMIDRSVGAVDASGYLLDSASLVAAGIIPAHIDLILPAYDVDVNGSPPPEHDEVLFNGQRLGLLTGDDRIWKLNSFRVDISKVKFPAPPVAGAAVVPRANKVQVNIDLLARGRWCTSLDWVALVLPIKPKFALLMQPVTGNKIRKAKGAATIDTIYQQTADSKCKLTETIGPINDYPFSGPAKPAIGSGKGRAEIKTKISPCPTGSLPSSAKVKVDWSIDSTSLKGIANWTGLEGNIPITMPAQVGAYTVTFKHTIDGEQQAEVKRKLFVTNKSPRATVNPPRLHWYEHATGWANGLNDEDKILKALLQGVYNYGNANWRYGYNFAAVTKCSWQDLADKPISCDYSDCYIFSDVFEHMAATLGVGGLGWNKKVGSGNGHFVTKKNPSLDPAFPGSAKPLGSSKYDRYVFSSHSLRLRGGTYYDATFNGMYSRNDQFISWNLSGRPVRDAIGVYYNTSEGAKVYVVPGSNSYDSWPDYFYVAPSPITGPEQPILKIPLKAMATDINLMAPIAYTPIDNNGNGKFDTLAVEMEFEILTAGTYTISANLSKGGTIIANQPSFDHAKSTQVVVGDHTGVQSVILNFSGEQLFRSAQSGPYDLEVTAIGEAVETQSFITPAYDHRDFAETGSRLSNPSSHGVDADGDGKFETLAVSMDINVMVAGNYSLDGIMLKNNQSLVDSSQTISLAPGDNQVSFEFDGHKIKRAGIDGPYQILMVLRDQQARHHGELSLTSAPLLYSDFAGIIELTGDFSSSGIDSNGNGLFDVLRLNLGVRSDSTQDHQLNLSLKNQTEPATVYHQQVSRLVAGEQQLSFDISGPQINGLGIDGPYIIDIEFRHPHTLATIDRIVVPQTTQAFVHQDFDSENQSNPIELTGTSSDLGVDTNGNGRFDRLDVRVEFALASSDRYSWSVSLVDSQGEEIGFNAASGTLAAGNTAITFGFNGERIGKNGVDGPYQLRNLSIFGRSGANLVATEVALTAAYKASEFEGYPLNQPPVAKCQNIRVNAALGVCHGEASIDDHSFDPDGQLISLVQTPAGPYPVGNTTVTLTVTDDLGATSSCSAEVTVLDIEAPTLVVGLSPNLLWPPNNKMKAIKARMEALDNCGTTAVSLTSISSNEDISDDVAEAAYGTPDDEFLLRAQRNGKGDGRSYLVNYSVKDSSGNQTTASAVVEVPHDQN